MWMAEDLQCLNQTRYVKKCSNNLKNIGLYSIAGLMFWLVGYNMAMVFLQVAL